MTSTSRRAARHVPTFHPLAVREVRAETDDSVIVTFDVPDAHADDYAFVAGQHVTLRCTGGDDELRRSYSICSPPGGPLRVGIRRVPGGAVSSWATTQLRAGDVVDVMTPAGGFACDVDETRARHVVGVAAGSGITPLRSIVESVLAGEPASRVTLLDVNRMASTTMFLEELADLKDTYLDRFALWHVFTREPHGADVLDHRPERADVASLVERRVLPVDADDYYLCGPELLVELVSGVLHENGVPHEHVHTELFVPGAPPKSAWAPLSDEVPTAPVAMATVVLHGRATAVPVREGEPLLDAALRLRPDLPYSCRAGACSTCRALLRDGEVSMAVNWGLESDEIAAGYVLACQARPCTPVVHLDFDA